MSAILVNLVEPKILDHFHDVIDINESNANEITLTCQKSEIKLRNSKNYLQENIKCIYFSLEHRNI